MFTLEVNQCESEYSLPGMLVKMHACAVSVYQAFSKEPGYEANPQIHMIESIQIIHPEWDW